MNADESKPDLPATSKPPRIYPRLNRRLRFAMWLAFLGGPVMIAMGAYEYYRTSKLKTEGAKSPGMVVDSNTLDTGKGRTSFRITVDYKPANDEATYRKEFFVPEAIYNHARQAGQVPVTYLPRDPAVSAVGDDIPVQTEPFAIGGGLILFAFAVLYYLRRTTKNVENYVTADV